MAVPEFAFESDAVSPSPFTIVGFSGSEGLSRLYRYEIELKAPTNVSIDMDDMLDNTARIITRLDGLDYPVHGVLASFDEKQTVQNYTYYRAVLVPRLWKLSVSRTNEIYTHELTIDEIIKTIFNNAGLINGTDYDVNIMAQLLQRDYVCQFRESDFDFISRLLENEGIYFYFEQGPSEEKLVLTDSGHYQSLAQPDIIYDHSAHGDYYFKSIQAWSCRKQRLPENVSVRDYNPDQPSLDVASTQAVDLGGDGTDYLYGENFMDQAEATQLAKVRSEEFLCNKTRYYGEGGVCVFRPGYCFSLDQHPKASYNQNDYLIVEVNHEARSLDSTADSSGDTDPYSNSFVAIDAAIQYRPPIVTPKPRFYGTMTAFVYAEAGKDVAEIDQQGRYRVHLPFDRADGSKQSSDPDRKASAWIRMATPYVGQDQGLYFPLTGGTEVLLTFINGDPDRPIISAALPNASQPPLLTSDSDWSSVVTGTIKQEISANTHKIQMNADAIDLLNNPTQEILGSAYINEGFDESNFSSKGSSMQPPWMGSTAASASPNQVKFRYYDGAFNSRAMETTDLGNVSTDRGSGDNYGYANGRTFYYPQHERVYFIGTFHEDFHVKDNFADPNQSWTGQREIFHFPAPGGDGDQGSPQKSEAEINPTGERGVSEDKRWGDMMFYNWGRSYNWSGGNGPGGSFQAYNYGNGYTENLITETGGDHCNVSDYVGHKDNYTEFYEGHPHFIPGIIAKIVGHTENKLKDQRYIDPGAAAIEKTFGSSYSYQMGYSVDIREGTSISKQYGDDISYVAGESHSVHHGIVDEKFMGGTSSLNFAGSNELNLAASTSIVGGIKSEIFLGGSFEAVIAPALNFRIGQDFDLKLAGGFKISPAFDAEAEVSKLENKTTNIQSATVQIMTQQAKITKALVRMDDVNARISRQTIGVHNAIMQMFA